MNPFILLTFLTLSALGIEHQSDSMIIEDFTEKARLDWRIINDGVMGGLSSSKMQVTEDGHGVFSGEVSLDNNGGFASTRALLPDADFSGVNRIRIKVRGDGNRYSFRVRTNRNFDGFAYVIPFDTEKDTWTTHILELADFTAQFRGYTLNDKPTLTGADMKQIEILIADKQKGPFRLEVDRIEGLK